MNFDENAVLNNSEISNRMPYTNPKIKKAIIALAMK